MKKYLSSDQMSLYDKDGYLILKEFCSKEEIDNLLDYASKDSSISDNVLDLNDESGKKTKLSLWFTPGDNIFGYLARSEKVVNSISQLLESDSPVCHFHSKLLQKKPRVGGAWEWHQDYGYWYKNQFMFPNQLISIMVALSPANKENGCIQFIKGSHKLGRLNHGFKGEQVGADMEMVDNALKTMEIVYSELNAGDALIFHSNILHRSAANLSENPRWSIISCYCSQSNLAYNESSSAWKEPIKVVPNDAILNWESESMSKVDFLKKENDPALKDTGWEYDEQN